MSKEAYKTLIYEPGEITRIIHNEPEKRNPLTGHFILELKDALARLQRDAQAVVGVLLSTGPVYCAGHNLEFVSRMEEWSPGTDRTPLSEEDWREQMDFMRENLYYPLWDCRKILITGVQGGAFAGGAEVPLMCDIVVAADNALFDYGVLHATGAGMMGMLPTFAGFRKATEVYLTGWNIDAKEALRLGMVNKIVPVHELEAEVMRYAQIVNLMPPESVRLTKQALKLYLNQMGARGAIFHGTEANILSHLARQTTEREFNRILRSRGIKAALDWVHKPFEEFGYSRYRRTPSTND